MDTSYSVEQILENEKGWLFYNAAMKVWKEMFFSILGNDVLDIGCASGISMALTKIFKPNINIFGFEGDNASREIWDMRNLTVKTGSIYNLPFPDNAFDTVYSTHVLEHLVDPPKAILESIRVSRKRIIHVVPNGNVNDKNFGTPHLHIYDRVNFMQLFDLKDLDIITYKNIEDVHMSSLLIAADVKK